jgi:hypothetical protein
VLVEGGGSYVAARAARRELGRSSTPKHTRKEVGAVIADAGRQLTRDRPRRCLIPAADAHLVFRPQIGPDLCCEVAHPVRQAALARRARIAFFDRADEPGRPLSETTSSGSPRPRARRSWKNARAVSMSSFELAISPKRTLRPSSPMPHAGRPPPRFNAVLETRHASQRPDSAHG